MKAVTNHYYISMTAKPKMSYVVSPTNVQLVIYLFQCGPAYPIDTYGWINVAIVASTCFCIPLLVIFSMYTVVFKKAHSLYRRLQGNMMTMILSLQSLAI